MAKMIDHRTEETAAPSSLEGRQTPFAEIDARDLEKARRDPTIRRFAEAADRYFAALRRPGRSR